MSGGGAGAGGAGAAKPFEALRLVRPEIAALSAYHVATPEGALRLHGNELREPLPPELAREFAAAMSQPTPNDYPESGQGRLREAAARYYGVPSGWVTCGNGSDEIIANLAVGFGYDAASGRARVGYPTPNFVMYRVSALLAGLTPVEVPLSAEMTLDGAAWLAMIEREQPNVVYLASPQNPTGGVVDEGLIRETLTRSAGLVVVDEAYIAYGGKTARGLLAAHPNLVVLNTLSKIGFAGLRVGVMLAHPEVIEEFEKVRMPFNLSSYAQAGGAWVFEHVDALSPLFARVVAERGRVSEALRGIEGFRVFSSEANFVLVRVPDASTIYAGLVSRGILVRNLDRAGLLEGCLRITIGTREENDALIAALKELT